MIIGDFFKALTQMNDRRFLSVLAKGIGLALLLLISVTLGVQWLLPTTVSLPLIGEIGWLSEALSGFVLIVMIGASMVLMMPVASIFVSLFLDQVTEAVEARHYRDAPPAKGVGIGPALADGFSFLLLMVGVNLLALIIYVLSTALAPVIFWIVNGILLGREYFQMVAMRRMSRAEAKALRSKHRLEIWAAGFLMAIPLSVPVVNLVIPVLGIATFTHIFHRLREQK